MIASCVTHAKELGSISDSARLDVELLLAHVLEKDRTYLYTWPEKTLSESEQENFFTLLERRKLGEPVAYLIGHKDFWSLSLSVNSSTLIPRPETELLVETALSYFTSDTDDTCRQVVDLGTGTGAIALALASEKPHWQVLAFDKSMEACELAEKNRQACKLNNVSVACSDWLHAVNEPVDLIVSNPPYIDGNDPHLSQGDVRFEPKSALVADNNGLGDFEIIARQATEKLRSNGCLLFEHGYQQAQSVQKILQENGFQDCFTVNDMTGHPRVTGGCMTQSNA